MAGKREKFWLGAPFGRLGKALGFRWIMPFGTIPLPFHPWFAWLLPWSIVALIGWRVVSLSVGEDGGIGWRSLLIAAALLAIPLAIPIIQWLAMAFRVPLLQGLCIGGAMVLLAADAWAGHVPFWAIAIPAAWLGLFILQRLAGPSYLRRLQAANERLGRIDPGDRLVIVEGDRVGTSYASHLSSKFAVARVAVDPDRSTRFARLKPQTEYRLAPAELAVIAKRLERLQPKDWKIWDGRITVPGIAEPGTAPPLRLRMVKHRAPFWLIGGRREALEISDGGQVYRLVGGKAALTGKWPLFVCFCYINIFNGAGRVDARWLVGFARGKEVDLGPARFWDMIPRAFTPLEEAASLPFADPAPLHAALDAYETEDRARDAAMLETLLVLGKPLPPVWHSLMERPELFAGRGAELCDCLAAAKAAKNETAVRLSAQLIAALPTEEFAGLRDRLLELLNSKALAFRLLAEGTDPNATEREKSKRVVGGFRLLRSAPRLYERLGELGEPARKLIMGLGRTSGWDPALVKARETLDARRSDS